MNVLLDTNIIGRMFQPGHAHHTIARTAVDSLVARGDTPCLVPQILYEFWVVATRPTSTNGLGLSPATASLEPNQLQQLFPLLLDGLSLFAVWQGLVTRHSVSGKSAHDARLVAAMQIHQVTHLLTFNIADFTRFTGVTILDPATMAQPGSP